MQLFNIITYEIQIFHNQNYRCIFNQVMMISSRFATKENSMASDILAMWKQSETHMPIIRWKCKCNWQIVCVYVYKANMIFLIFCINHLTMPPLSSSKISFLLFFCFVALIWDCLSLEEERKAHAALNSVFVRLSNC